MNKQKSELQKKAEEGSIGGDILIVRVYADGRVYER